MGEAKLKQTNAGQTQEPPPNTPQLAAWRKFVMTRDTQELMAQAKIMIFDPRLPDKMLQPNLGPVMWRIFQAGWDSAILFARGEAAAPPAAEEGSDATNAGTSVDGGGRDQGSGEGGGDSGLEEEGPASKPSA